MAQLEGHVIRKTPSVLKPSVLLILTAAFVTSLSTYMAQPFFILYYHQALHFSSLEAGVLIAIMPLCGALFGVVGGYVSDFIGIRKAYASALLLSGFCMAGFAFFRSFFELFILSAVLGLCMATTRSGAQALLKGRVAEEQAGTAQTYLYWLNNLSIIVGPPVAALLLGAGAKANVFVVSSILMVVMSLCVLLLLDSPLKTQKPSGSEASATKNVRPPSFLQSMSMLQANRRLRWTFFALFFYIMLEAQLTSTVPLYMSEKFTEGSKFYGFINTEVAAIALFLTPILARITKKKSVLGVLSTGILVLGIGLVVAGFSGSVIGWYIGICFYGLGEVTAMPKINEVMVDAVDKEQPATSFAALNTSLFLGMFAGYAIGPSLIAQMSSGWLYTGALALAVLSVICFINARRAIVVSQSVSLEVEGHSNV
ncbi:MFS transporter [Alicyclobacillus tolerans]|uniref:MFS family permease n=2 Tax=Alicyclobacillus tolerans TaxID=90970 RepID=A0ABT9LYT7_9BACL|nr:MULTISPECIES: MFS transporter [Alicyclobacillus]MDP9729429.1 MFS family permease [Alicyclobacillus tengchongensis]SHK22289.1 Sugar phosphate permease [Alicyclobacillus montanus]